MTLVFAMVSIVTTRVSSGVCWIKWLMGRRAKHQHVNFLFSKLSILLPPT